MNDSNTSNLVLVGFMGTGKTTVGKILSKRMQRRFVDLDREIEARAGQSITKLFETKGEQAFRELEQQVVQDISSRSSLIIACGGGVILNEKNIRTLSTTGTVICLQASAQQVLKRISHHTHRPLLEGEDREIQLQKIYDERKPLYDALPLQVNTDGLSLQEVVRQAQTLFQGE